MEEGPGDPLEERRGYEDVTWTEEVNDVRSCGEEYCDKTTNGLS